MSVCKFFRDARHVFFACMTGHDQQVAPMSTPEKRKHQPVLRQIGFKATAKRKQSAVPINNPEAQTNIYTHELAVQVINPKHQHWFSRSIRIYFVFWQSTECCRLSSDACCIRLHAVGSGVLLCMLSFVNREEHAKLIVCAAFYTVVRHCCLEIYGKRKKKDLSCFQPSPLFSFHLFFFHPRWP